MVLILFAVANRKIGETAAGKVESAPLRPVGGRVEPRFPATFDRQIWWARRPAKSPNRRRGAVRSGRNMIQSAATKYAIRAVCYLAHLPEGTFAQVREVSAALDIPQPYLSKILQDLGKKGILSSSKGPGGGFRLNCSPTETSLYTVIEAVEGPQGEDECLLGLSICSEDTKCPMHDFWSEIQAAFRQQMASISLLDIVEAEQRKVAAIESGRQEK